jgi:hypothetical protein
MGFGALFYVSVLMLLVGVAGNGSPGWYRSVMDPTGCDQCPADTFSGASGATSAAVCAACEKGFSTARAAGSSTCTRGCPAGKFPLGGVRVDLIGTSEYSYAFACPSSQYACVLDANYGN